MKAFEVREEEDLGLVQAIIFPLFCFIITDVFRKKFCCFEPKQALYLRRITSGFAIQDDDLIELQFALDPFSYPTAVCVLVFQFFSLLQRRISRSHRVVIENRLEDLLLALLSLLFESSGSRQLTDQELLLRRRHICCIILLTLHSSSLNCRFGDDQHLACPLNSEYIAEPTSADFRDLIKYLTGGSRQAQKLVKNMNWFSPKITCFWSRTVCVEGNDVILTDGHFRLSDLGNSSIPSFRKDDRLIPNKISEPMTALATVVQSVMYTCATGVFRLRCSTSVIQLYGLHLHFLHALDMLRKLAAGVGLMDRFNGLLDNSPAPSASEVPSFGLVAGKLNAGIDVKKPSRPRVYDRKNPIGSSAIEDLRINIRVAHLGALDNVLNLRQETYCRHGETA